MGAWGTESCSNDSCWDCLEAIDIHKMTQKEADESIDKLWMYGTDKDRLYPGAALTINNDKLGVIVWVLSQRLKVSIKKLKECLSFAKESLNTKNLEESGWRDIKERSNSLKKEIALIESAIKNKGKGEKVHIKGLFEKIDEMTKERTKQDIIKYIKQWTKANRPDLVEYINNIIEKDNDNDILLLCIAFESGILYFAENSSKMGY